MPVIVVGADTPVGISIIDALIEPDREVRAFVSDATVAEELKERGVKVALGDVSDPSHVAGACLNCFSAVLVTEAASDARERAFAQNPNQVLAGWVDAVTEAAVSRVIWVGTGHRAVPGIESAVVESTDPDIPGRVAALDDAAEL
ncbi:MAG: NAD(P)H-binding protein [Acidimicrobiia bacterium]|nr:NAD(P)H-binding protein [Acidimicrobiia bacterium]